MKFDQGVLVLDRSQENNKVKIEVKTGYLIYRGCGSFHKKHPLPKCRQKLEIL